ncbi:tripartite tricarboxylate transporter TctB family protein [Enterovirga aerilata]|uniref:Tripartite tricarboxylate transporter TctB family protein n=1 Tax=Enterovirga aerilata TaxID=2730920 RepID=A0A849IAS9_9HYPH|nr:tripartite tricarboxylate transporter TctB family protein [Enterovirga sp. DB1703]
MKPLSRDVLAGLLFAGAGIGFVIMSRNYNFGAGTRMGPGMFPTLVGSLLALLGAVIALRGLRSDAGTPDRFHLRPFVLVLLAIAVFTILVEPLGLFITTLLTVAVAALADRELSKRAAAVTAVVLAIGSCVVFVTLLGLQLAIWPSFFG